MTGQDHEDELGLAGAGLTWSWDLDLDALVAAVSETAGQPASPAPPDDAGADPVEAESGEYDLTDLQPPADLPPILGRVLAAARRASPGAELDGCAHAEYTPAYRPTRKLWEYVTARDVTCRFLTCRQPATRCDLDHTTPFDQGGRTCSCNLGAVCRYHHQIKQHPRWHLDQPVPGTLTWTTPTGRTYTTQPDSHAA